MHTDPNSSPNIDPNTDPNSNADPNPTNEENADSSPTATEPVPENPEVGLATAELLGNAALGIAALVAIWAVLQTVGIDVMHWIRAQLLV